MVEPSSRLLLEASSGLPTRHPGPGTLLLGQTLHHLQGVPLNLTTKPHWDSRKSVVEANYVFNLLLRTMRLLLGRANGKEPINPASQVDASCRTADVSCSKQACCSA